MANVKPICTECGSDRVSMFEQVSSEFNWNIETQDWDLDESDMDDWGYRCDACNEQLSEDLVFVDAVTGELAGAPWEAIPTLALLAPEGEA